MKKREQSDRPVAAIICGLGLPWQRGVWVGYDGERGFEIENVQAPTGQQRTRVKLRCRRCQTNDHDGRACPQRGQPR